MTTCCWCDTEFHSARRYVCDRCLGDMVLGNHRRKDAELRLPRVAA